MKFVTGWGFETFTDTSILRRLVRGAGPPTDPRQSNAWVVADPDVTTTSTARATAINYD